MKGEAHTVIQKSGLVSSKSTVVAIGDLTNLRVNKIKSPNKQQPKANIRVGKTNFLSLNLSEIIPRIVDIIPVTDMPMKIPDQPPKSAMYEANK